MIEMHVWQQEASQQRDDHLREEAQQYEAIAHKAAGNR